MDIAFIRAHCLALPFVTEHVQWGDNLVFKIGVAALGEGAKIFAIAALEVEGREDGRAVTLKADPDEYAELVERPGIQPAPYLARAKWVSVEQGALTLTELAAWIAKSHQLVFAGLPKSKQKLLSRASQK